MRAVFFILGLTLAGCTTPPISGEAPRAGEITGSAAQAYFTDYPERLFFVAEDLCDGATQMVVKPNRNQLRCESLPDPESAAAIILQHGGTVEDLPKFVISFSGRDTAQGYLVTVDNYIRVPQRNGGAQQIRFEDEDTRDSLAELLQTAGGRPL